MTEAVMDKGFFTARYLLNGLSCSSCASRIEEAVQDLPYVLKAEMNFAIGRITVKGSSNNIEEMTDEIQVIADRIENGINVEKEIQKIADRIEPGLTVSEVGTAKRYRQNRNEEREQFLTQDEHSDVQAVGQNRGTGTENKYLKFQFIPGLLLFALAVILFELPTLKVLSTDIPHYLEWIIYGVSYLLIGGPVLFAAFRNIIRGQVFDENFLMSIATIGAFAIQQFPEGVAVMLFYMIGEMFQDKAVDKSRRSIKELMDIRPDYANVKLGEETIKVDPELVDIGELIVVKPGEKVPLDGKVVEGSSMVDTSALTGESVPRKIGKGDDILSGMINKNGLLTIEVTKEYGQSTVSKILDLVENASGKKAETEKFITKFSRYYTPVVVFSALAIAVIPPIFIPEAVFSDWLYRALIFLVVSCPCALVVSIPLGFFGGIGRASRQGILVKGGNYLEALNNVTQIVFDKTGTLTKGKFAVDQVESYNGFNKEELLTKAAYAERHSTHPIAKSILEAYEKLYDREVDNNKIEEYQEISGRGIEALIEGKKVLAGNSKLMAKGKIDFQEVEADGTVVHLAIDNKYAGYISITDQVKEDSAAAIKDLKELGVEELTMLTGDRKTVAEKVAKRLELDSYYAELLPDQKVEKVEELLKKKGKREKLIFVGDGINDAPVLARSDIGVAMGGLGSDAAIEAADVVLMTDEPYKLVTAIQTARKTRNIVWQNVALALGIKGVVLVMGALGAATMWEAVFADVGVALLAVLNAMRISRNV